MVCVKVVRPRGVIWLGIGFGEICVWRMSRVVSFCFMYVVPQVATLTKPASHTTSC